MRKNESEKIERQIQAHAPKCVFMTWSGKSSNFSIYKSQCQQVRAMKISPTEQLSLVKSFTGDKKQASLLDLFSYSANPINEILELFENQFGRAELQLPNIKREIQAVPETEENTDRVIVLDRLRAILLNLKKIKQLSSEWVPKEFCFELVHKLRPTD